VRAASHGARSLGGTTADRNIVVFGLGVLFCALLIAVLPDLAPAQSGLISDRAHGRIATVSPGDISQAPQATVLILDGDRRGDTITATLESPTSQAAIPDYAPGDEVLVAIDLQPDGTVTYSVIDRWRAPILLAIVGMLALLTIVIAGWRGLRALTSLAITVVVVVRLLIPLLLSGYSPVLLAVALGILITVLSLLLTQGLSRATAAAVLGTAIGLVVTGVLALIVSTAAQFTSAQGSEEVAVIAQIAGGTIDLSGLLLAAVIFGGLGVLNDVAITQAVTIDEFRSIDPTMPRRDLYRRAMSVGTAHLAATVNTLVFAYLGSALPVIVLLALQIHRLDLAVNDEHIAVEVVRTVVGAIGVLSAVPLTTAIAAWWAGAPSHPAAAPRRVMALPVSEMAGALAGGGDVSEMAGDVAGGGDWADDGLAATVAEPRPGRSARFRPRLPWRSRTRPERAAVEPTSGEADDRLSAEAGTQADDRLDAEAGSETDERPGTEFVVEADGHPDGESAGEADVPPDTASAAGQLPGVALRDDPSGGRETSTAGTTSTSMEDASVAAGPQGAAEPHLPAQVGSNGGEAPRGSAGQTGRHVRALAPRSTAAPMPRLGEPGATPGPGASDARNGDGPPSHEA